MSITIRFLRERGDLRWRAIECVLVTLAIVTKNGRQNRFKIEKLRFLTNFEALGECLFKN